MRRVLILGAAGRDFHDFNVIFRNNPEFRVVAFTATQIPDIAGRRYPAALAGELYPDGIPILEEDKMEQIIRDEHVDEAVFAYSDVPYATLMHLASRAVAAGADFKLLAAERTQLAAEVPVVSICAVRTGCGKSPVSRRIAAELRNQGWHPVVVRHPMPYGDLTAQRAQRFASLADLDRHECTIEEREEYEPHIVEGTTVYAGVDYLDILRQAEKEGDVILWDGGNNDTSFYRSDLKIVVLDPHRAGHELGYYPGEVNFRSADVLIINKVDTADPDGIKTVRRNIALYNPDAKVIEMACRVTVDDPDIISGKTVLVVEDGPTLTHGEMPYGAGVVAANRYHAAALVDPRPYAIGSIKKAFEKFPHLWRVLPAMGYSDTQRHELEATIKRVPCDLVVVATPIDLARTIKLEKPNVCVHYEVEELGKPTIGRLIEQFTETYKPELAGAGR
ncbi:MAG: cyclic 2,3-diphosphoglycerate synthase [Candidatus Korobacteraceae bacterium]